MKSNDIYNNTYAAQSRGYPSSGYTSALGQLPSAIGPGRGSKLNSIDNAKSLSPSKNSISQNGQMVLNLNKNTIQSIMKSTDLQANGDDFMQKRSTIFSGSELGRHPQYSESPSLRNHSGTDNHLKV